MTDLLTYCNPPDLAMNKLIIFTELITGVNITAHSHKDLSGLIHWRVNTN